MKKILLILLILLLVLPLSSLTGCTSDDEVDATDLTGHALVGRWAWDQNTEYVFTFFDDGTGGRGFAARKLFFVWYATDDMLWLNVHPTGYEQWSYTITDGVLSIDSQDVAGRSFNYHRLP